MYKKFAGHAENMLATYPLEAFAYDNVQDRIDKLNGSSLPNIINMQGNRAYMIDGQPYADLLHFKNIHEPAYAHSFNLKKVRERQNHFSDKAYLGAGGIINLSYIAASQSACGIMYDINPFQRVLWEEVFNLLAECSTPVTFIDNIRHIEEQLRKRIEHANETIRFSNSNSITYTFDKLASDGFSDRLFRRHGGIKEWLLNPAGQDHNWLQGNYAHLHDLAKRKALAAITLDILDPHSCHEFSKHMKQEVNGFKVGMIYISSIADFLAINKEWTGRSNPDFKNIILENLDALNPEMNATIIDGRNYWTQSQKMSISISNGFFPVL